MLKKENKGITLVALVITIIILLILATISIQSLTNTGLFAKAQEAKEKTQNAAENQAKTLNEYEDELNKYISGTTGENTEKLAYKVKVGDYVSYKPDTLSNEALATLKTNLNTYSGKSDSTINPAIKRDDLNWRVLDVQNGQVRLISEVPTDSKIELKGYNGYNNAAGLLADRNHFPGIDIVKFGQNISVIQKRATIENISILEVYDKAIDMFRDYYQYEIIEGAERKNVEKIPEAAFREAIANALIHRAWDIESQIRVLMFDDRLEVISPGGLPSGITEDEYLSGKISVLRNRNLANVFYRLGFVEIFGTGITRIKQLYESALRKPDFEVSENTIRIMLPVFEENINLTEDEKQVYALLSTTMLKPISEIAPYTPFGKSKTTQLLKEMSQKGVVEVKGKGRGTKYIIKRMN